MSKHDKYVEKWVGYLHKADREMSRIAAKKLGETKDNSVVPELVKALYNRPDDVRIAAIRAIGEIGDVSGVQPLIEMLNENDQLISSAAVDSLGEIGSEMAVPHLVEILKNFRSSNQSRHKQLHGFDRGVFMAAIHALQRIGTPAARKAIDKYQN